MSRVQTITNLRRHPRFLAYENLTSQRFGKRDVTKPACDVFINHRGKDTKRHIVTLLYDHLFRLNLNPFLDNKNMKPGDKLFDNINSAIKDCKVAVTVFSPTYCDSYFCLHELALIMESKKKVVPIFCDIKPSQIRVVNDGKHPAHELTRFESAVEEAKGTVGLTFDSLKGNWSEVVTNASNIVIQTLIEMEAEAQIKQGYNTQLQRSRYGRHGV